jgi:nitroreductase
MINDDALDRIFRKARTHRAWLDRPVPESLLRQVYELACLGPTSANCSPMRVLFATTREAKDRLRPCLTPGNVDKTMQAPVTAIIGHDLEFYERLPRLFPTADMRANFVGKPELIAATAFRNGSLQGAYVMLRRDVRLRQLKGRRRVLPGGNGQVELPLQPGLRGPGEAFAVAAAAAAVRRGLPSHLSRCPTGTE